MLGWLASAPKSTATFLRSRGREKGFGEELMGWKKQKDLKFYKNVTPKKKALRYLLNPDLSAGVAHAGLERDGRGGTWDEAILPDERRRPARWGRRSFNFSNVKSQILILSCSAE